MTVPAAFFRQRIRHERAQYDMQERADQRAHNGDPVSLPDSGVVKHLGVILEREFSRQEINRAHHRIFAVIQRISQNVNERIDHGKANQSEHRIIEYRKKDHLRFISSPP